MTDNRGGNTVSLVLGILSLIVGLISILARYDLHQRGGDPEKNLTLHEGATSDPVWLLSRYDQVEVTLTVAGEPVRELRVSDATLSNEGKAPIKPSDFHAPLTVSVNDPWKILAVESPRTSSLVGLDWTPIDSQQYIASPFLFNPGDRATIRTYLAIANPDAKAPEDKPRLTYDTRILNLKNISKPRRDRLDRLFDLGPVVVFLSGRSLNAWFLLFAIYYASYIYLGRKAEWFNHLTAGSILVLVALALLGAAAAESTVDLIFPDLLTLLGSTHYSTYMVLAVHSALLIYLLWRTGRARTRSR